MRKNILILIIILFITGCSCSKKISNGNKKTDSAQLSNNYNTKLLKDIEKSDILFYKKSEFLEISFSVRDSLSYTAGKDIYNISYLSNAEPNDIYNAHLKYIDNVIEKWTDDYSLNINGTVNNLPISVSIEKKQLANIKGYPVRITISEKPEKFENDNRYFFDYPNEVELYKSKKSSIHHTSIDYTESYKDEDILYNINFLTTANIDDFSSYYNEKYKDYKGFKLKEDEYQKEFSWSDKTLDYKVQFQISNNMASLSARTKLEKQ